MKKEINEKRHLKNANKGEYKKMKTCTGITKKGVLSVIVMVLLSAILTGCTIDPIEEMNRQLEEMDSTSFTEIMTWLEEELEEYEEVLDDFLVFIWSEDINGNILQEGIIDNEARFVEFQFMVTEVSLWIDMIYMSTEDYVEMRLAGMDRNSMSEIREWIDDNEDVLEVSMRINTVDTEGNWISDDIFDQEGVEDLFVEWSVAVDTWRIEFEFVFETSMTFGLGDTFVAGGLEFAFGTEIMGGMIDDSWSIHHEELYFRIPVTIVNVSDSSIDWVRIDKYGPDGTALDRIWHPDNDDDVERMSGLRPGATLEGYVFFLFAGDGEYVAEFRNRPIDIELVFTVDSNVVDFPDPPPPITLEELIEVFGDDMIADIMGDVGEFFDVTVEARGNEEIIYTFALREAVPAGNRAELIEILEEALDYIEEMGILLELVALVMIDQLGTDSLTITYRYLDNAGEELASRSFSFSSR